LSHCNIGSKTSANVPLTIKAYWHVSGNFHDNELPFQYRHSYTARTVKKMKNGAHFLSVDSQESERRRTLFLIHRFRPECL